MRVLITGGAGMVGSHCAEFYAGQGAEVVVLDNLMRSTLFGYSKDSVEYNWNYLKKYKNIRHIKGDVRNKADVEKAIGQKVDLVIHTAGQPGVPSSVRMPLEDFDINAFGTLNVLECLRQKSPKATFIYTSTNKVFGENVDKIPLVKGKTRYTFKGKKGINPNFALAKFARRADRLNLSGFNRACSEEFGEFPGISPRNLFKIAGDRGNPGIDSIAKSGINELFPTDLTGHTPYGVSKLVGDLYTQEYAHIYNLRTAVFRMSCIYGIRQFGFEDQGWVAWFVIANLKNKPITIYGDGKQVRDLLYVTDLVNAFDCFYQSKLGATLFNIGGGEDNTASLLEFIEALEKQTSRKTRIKFSSWRPSDQKVYITDITKARKLLGWQPSVNIQEGISRVIGWVRENKTFFK